MSGQDRLAVKACVFDAYGTLFDFASAAAQSSRLQPEMAAAVTSLWRDKQLQYTWLRGLQGRHADFWEVTSDALEFALETLGLPSDSLHDDLMGLYLSLSCFPEVPAVLQELKRSGFVTAILSNGTPQMLRAAVENSGLSDLIDHILSVEAVGVFKPHPSVYQLAVDRLGLPAGAVSFQSSNAWDAHAASAFGMKVVWCNRYGQRPERLPGAPDRQVRTLSELPQLIRQE